MAGMKRFVTYIYAYEDKKKGNNIGFAKIEIRGEDCRIEIHLRGVYARQSACRVYLFRDADSTMEGILIGEMQLANGNGDFGVIIKAARIGESSFGVADMEGIFLLTEDDRIFMSRWKEGKPLVVCRENFREWMPQSEWDSRNEMNAEPELALAEKPLQKVQAEKEIPKKEAVRAQTKEGKPNEKAMEEERATENESAVGVQDMQATEIPVRNIFWDSDWQNTWEALVQGHMLYHPFEESGTECIQIELKNLRELPKRYWYLGNNSFLLHGFFNYQYLIVGKTAEGRWFIGVPGVYQRQERVMAVIFGFPEFMAVPQEHTENEENGEPINRFGFWVRFIEE